MSSWPVLAIVLAVTAFYLFLSVYLIIRVAGQYLVGRHSDPRTR